MPTLKTFFAYALIPVLILGTSCVKDIDLDQASEIVVSPTAAIDLVYFTIALEDFSPTGTTGPKMAGDVVRLEFLDDDYIQNDLSRADLNFVYYNSFTNPVRSDLIFLSEGEREQYRISFTIPGGSPAAPGVINYTEIIQGEDLEDFKNSIKLRVELEMFSGPVQEGGELQLKSKAFLKFDF